MRRVNLAGEQDETRKKAELLVKKFNGAIVVRHPGGRVVPKLGVYLSHKLTLSKLINNGWSKNRSNFIEKWLDLHIMTSSAIVSSSIILAMARTFQFFRFWVVDQIC